MIIIPTYNGFWSLNQLIKGLEKCGTMKHSILIVDNGTTEPISKKYLEQLAGYVGPLDIKVETNKHGGYEAGALIHATREYPNEEKFILLHDSCRITSDQWLKQFDERLTPERGAVAWVKFQPCLFCVFEPHLEYMNTVLSWDSVPDSGIFGSIFYTYGSILRDWDERGFFNNPPSCKIHAESWERIWAILFHNDGFDIDHVIKGFEPRAIHYGHYPHLSKTFGGRL